MKSKVYNKGDWAKKNKTRKQYANKPWNKGMHYLLRGEKKDIEFRDSIIDLLTAGT